MKIFTTVLFSIFYIFTTYGNINHNFDSIADRDSNDNIKSIDVGVCTKFSNSSFLKDCGYSYIEENVGSLLIPNKDEEAFNNILNNLKDNPLPIYSCNGFIPAELRSVGPDAMHEEILKFAETAFRRANILGIKVIVFGSSGSRNIPEGFDSDVARKQFIDLCKNMGPIAEKYGVTVAIEPLNKKESNFINSVAEGGELLKEVNHPNIKLLVDIYHMLMEDEKPESIIKYGKYISHVHIAEKQDRTVPGTHNENFSSYFNALKEIGYEGKISIEARWSSLEEQAKKAIETILYQYNY